MQAPLRHEGVAHVGVAHVGAAVVVRPVDERRAPAMGE